MSYTRASKDSDVMVYDNGAGEIIVSVAHNAWEAPPKDVMDTEEKLMAYFKRPQKPLKNKHAGQTFRLRTREGAIRTLRKLHASGLQVPERAVTRLREEIHTKGDRVKPMKVKK